MAGVVSLSTKITTVVLFCWKTSSRSQIHISVFFFFFYTVKFTVSPWPDMKIVRTLIKEAENTPNGSICHQWLLVMYISPAAALDSDLWTLFPVESHVERSEPGSSQTLHLFLVSQGHDVKIKRFNNMRNTAEVRVCEIVSKEPQQTLKRWGVYWC